MPRVVPLGTTVPVTDTRLSFPVFRYEIYLVLRLLRTVEAALNAVEPACLVEVWFPFPAALTAYEILYTPVVGVDVQRRAG